MLRVTDHLNPTQPESLNVIAWKEGRDDSCVQGMGGHMDIMPRPDPPAAVPTKAHTTTPLARSR